MEPRKEVGPACGRPGLPVEQSSAQVRLLFCSTRATRAGLFAGWRHVEASECLHRHAISAYFGVAFDLRALDARTCNCSRQLPGQRTAFFLNVWFSKEKIF